MEQRGYTVELGRGIAFTDQQQVRFKGSQVGFALADIEKRLKQQQQQEQIQRYQQRQTQSYQKRNEEENKNIKQSRGITR